MNKAIKIFIIIILVSLTSCIDEESIPIINIGLEDSARLVEYIESRGDFPNSPDAPALILASELYNKINDYWIIDVRSAEEFSQGHIESALNTVPANLIKVVDSLNLISPLKQIVIVSKNGQSSTYFTCILRIAGYDNVFTLNYGMASWNILFAEDWLQSLATSSDIFSYTNDNYPKSELKKLPEIAFPSELVTIEQKIRYRAEKILTDGFKEEEAFIREFGLETRGANYLICYGKGRLYNAPRSVPLGELGHPANVVWYNASSLFDFRSTRDLQTLPNNNGILMYSGDGQLSACMSAYLRFLGYDAKTLLFGANQLFYPRMQSDPELIEDLFSVDDIMDYPYVIGN